MALSLKQSMKLSTSLVMTPQLQQAIKLLQLSRTELQDAITAEMVENPILEEDSMEGPSVEVSIDEDGAEPNTVTAAETGTDGPPVEEGPKQQDDFDWDGYLNSFNSSSNTPSEGFDGGEELPTLEQTLSQKNSLQEHLMWQVKLSNLGDKETDMAEQIIWNINDDGYLSESLEYVAEHSGHFVHEVEAVLYKIQGFDPHGVGARNLKECLLLQLYNLELHDDLVEELIENHLEDLEKRNYKHICKEMQITAEELKEMIEVVERLDPKPGKAYSAPDSQYITPDVYIRNLNGELVVLLNDDGLPRLKISNFYKNMMTQAKTSGQAKEYIQEKLKSAAWLIKSIQQRQRTIYKVAESIAKFQNEFFFHGITHLKPLVLRDVANDVGLHESTISRVTTSKYVHTPQGIFELKFFFNSTITRRDPDGGGDMASEAVKQRIRALISSEPNSKPLSDQQLVEILKKENVDIARRTVAKYREMLGINPSSRRKQLI